MLALSFSAFDPQRKSFHWRGGRDIVNYLGGLVLLFSVLLGCLALGHRFIHSGQKQESARGPSWASLELLAHRLKSVQYARWR
jgi:hypothetical protein